MSIDLLFEEDYAVLTINRPKALNALSFAIITQIGEALQRVSESQARVLIITGAGEKAFCAGADIQELTGRSLAEEKGGGGARTARLSNAGPSEDPIDSAH